MKRVLYCGAQFCLASIGFGTTLGQPEKEAQTQPYHNWDYLYYEAIQDPEIGTLRFHLAPGFQFEELRLQIMSSSAEMASDIHSVTILREGGLREPPLRSSGRDVGAIGRANSLIYNWDATFAWDKEQSRAAWIAFSVDEQKYHLEVPYGFAQDPRQPPKAVSRSGRPVFPVPDHVDTPDTHIHPVNFAHYDLGGIQQGWRLSFKQFNPGDAKTEVVLYRDDHEVGKSMYLWSLFEPRTQVQRVNESGSERAARPVTLHLHDDGMRRTDTFLHARNGGDSRGWVQIAITVGDHAVRQSVPTSMTGYFHGISDAARQNYIMQHQRRNRR